MKTTTKAFLKTVWSYMSYMSYGFPRFEKNPKSNGIKLNVGYFMVFAIMAWILSMISGLSFWDAVLAWSFFSFCSIKLR